jgi:hypothetical protein
VIDTVGGSGPDAGTGPGEELARLRREVLQLRNALDHRPETERVVGMIMLMAACDADTAWRALSTVSQHTNRKVRDVAAMISVRVAAGHGLPAEIVSPLRQAVATLEAPRAAAPSAVLG